METKPNALGMSIQFEHRVIHKFVEEKKNWEEQEQNYTKAAPQPGFHKDVIEWNRGVKGSYRVNQDVIGFGRVYRGVTGWNKM